MKFVINWVFQMPKMCLEGGQMTLNVPWTKYCSLSNSTIYKCGVSVCLSVCLFVMEQRFVYVLKLNMRHIIMVKALTKG